MSVEIFEPVRVVSFTPNGTKKIKNLLGNATDEFLRIYIEGGGCSGFQYGFKLEKEVNEDDVLFNVDGAKVAIDTMSYQYLLNSEVDYKEDLMGSMFVISNPQAESTCGCGLSFTIKQG